jgi:hypothetical protein
LGLIANKCSILNLHLKLQNQFNIFENASLFISIFNQKSYQQ